jgi:hypothetical protein
MGEPRQEPNLHRPGHDCVEIESSIRLSYAADAPNHIDESVPVELTPNSANIERDVNSWYTICPNSISSAVDDFPLASICSGANRSGH